MPTLEDGGGILRPNAARVQSGRLAVTLLGIDGAEEEIVTTRNTIHERIHEGIFWSGGVLDVALANLGVMELLIQTGAIPVHARFAGAGSQSLRTDLFEGTTFSAAGTPVAAVARNRQLVQVPLTVLTTAPTLTLDGTQLFGGFIPGGTGPQSEGGTSSSFNEYVLAPNTVYLARLTNNLAGGTSVTQLSIEFYEDPDFVSG